MGKSVDQIPEKYASDDDVEQKPQGESSWLGGLQNTVGNAALSGWTVGGAAVGGMLGGPLGAFAGGYLGQKLGEWMNGGPQQQNPNADPGFVKATEGGVPSAEFPDKVVLPPELTKAADDGWSKSFPDGKSKEQGGILVQNKDGSYEFKSGSTSTSGSFTPNLEDKGSDQSVRVLHHDHPYDASEGGYENVTFSGGDLANLVYQDVPFKTVKSGEGMFGVGKSKEFSDRVAGLDGDGKKKLSDEMKKLHTDTMANTKGTFQERADAATRAVTQAYGLPYYKGSGNELNRVDTSK